MTDNQTDADAKADSRIAEIQREMQSGSYWHTPATQAEYLRLVEARSKRAPPAAR